MSLSTTTTPPVAGTRGRRIAYRVLLGLPALAVTLAGGQLLISGWFSTVDGGSHRYHELSWGVLEAVVIVVGLVASLWRPTRRPAAYQQVLVGLGALGVTMALIREIDVATIVVGALIIGGGFLHPARQAWRELGPWDGPSLMVGAIVAAPLVWYAVGESALHRAAPAGDPHMELAHYAGTTAVALALAGVAVLSASRRPGHRLVTTTAAVGLAVLGIASLVWPDLDSSLGITGGIAALVAAAAVAATGLRPADDGTSHGRTAAVTLALAVVAGGVACGSDADTAQPEADATATADGAGEAIEVVGVDFAFEGVPAETTAGTSFTFTNASDAEVHEMIVMRIDDAETRPLEALLELPDEEVQQLVQPVGMQLALPGEDGIDPESPATASPPVTVSEPGRYVFLCFLPEGGDPEVYRAALAGEGDGGPPDAGDGPPHATLGMVTELTVTE